MYELQANVSIISFGNDKKMQCFTLKILHIIHDFTRTKEIPNVLSLQVYFSLRNKYLRIKFVFKKNFSTEIGRITEEYFGKFT